MSIPPELVQLWNAAHPQLGLSAARTEELPIELGQLRAAAEAMRLQVAFDIEPGDFRTVLSAAAKAAPHR
jgi:hypothetical protein